MGIGMGFGNEKSGRLGILVIKERESGIRTPHFQTLFIITLCLNNSNMSTLIVYFYHNS